MKHLKIIAVLILLFTCKDEKNIENPNTITDTEQREDIFRYDDTLNSDNRDLPKTNEFKRIELKQRRLIDKRDERAALKDLITDKKYIVNAQDYTINLNYPLLNESLKPTHVNFNNFIKDYYVNVPKMEAEILETKLICEDIESIKFNEMRYIDYKIYEVNDQLISLLFYKENFYSGALHPLYSFNCFNFHLNRGVFMTYEDFFTIGSEEQMINIINQQILNDIKQGETYYDCWELVSTDFFEAKNNFVLNDTYLEYYFDDCVICPSYTGTYSVKIQLTDLLPILKKMEADQLVF